MAKKAKKVKEVTITTLKKYTPTTTQHTVGDVMNHLVNDDYSVAPFFQREYVWDKNDESYLIETIILGYSIPTFFAYETVGLDNKGRAWGRTLFSDGQQRLTAIRKFIHGDSMSEKTGKKNGRFTLKNLKVLPQLNGLGWNDFKNILIRDEEGNLIDLQKRINEYQLTMSVFPEGTPIEIIQDHYTRHNTSGKNLSHAAERRNLYFSRYYSFLRELANDEVFLSIIGNNGCGKKKREQAHESYAQLWAWTYLSKVYNNGIVSYKDNPNKKGGEVDKHLGSMKEKDALFTDDVKNNMRSAFMKATRLINKLFGEDAFKKPTVDETTWEFKVDEKNNKPIKFGPFNEAFFECLMYLFSYADEQSVLDNQKGIVKSIYSTVKNNREFYEAVNKRVRTKKSADVRFPAFHKVLKEQGVKFIGI